MIAIRGRVLAHFIKRRQFLAALGGAATWPLAARAQQSAVPVIGFLRSGTFADVPHWVAAFRHGLQETGLTEGQHFVIEFRNADNQPSRLQSLVAELLPWPVAVIVGNTDSAMVAKRATAIVPIVFAGGGDPVSDGLVTSFNRPGGNVTGVSFLSGGLGAKRLELLRHIVPRANTVAMLVNSAAPPAEPERNDVQQAARTMGVQLIAIDIRNGRDIEPAFASFIQRGAGALMVGTGGLLNSERKTIVALADRHALPASYSQREGVDAGGLMSYGASIAEAYRQAGIYAARILKGERPADLPVIQSAKFEFVLNRRVATTLGLDVPATLLALADDVIE